MRPVRPGIAGVTALVAAELARLDWRIVNRAVRETEMGAAAADGIPGAVLTDHVAPREVGALAALAEGVMVRPPDRVIARGGVRYLERWYLRRHVDPRIQSDCAMYLHRVIADDHPPAHDHPWVSCSVLVAGRMVEQYRDPGAEWVTELWLEAGDVVLRTAACAHLLTLVDGPAITICATGPRKRKWGFV